MHCSLSPRSSRCRQALAAARNPAAPGKGRTGMFLRLVRGTHESRAQASSRFWLRKARALEQFSEALSALRLPRLLQVKFASCDGESNAWYEASEKTVVFCYEYVAKIEQASSGAIYRVSGYGIHFWHKVSHIDVFNNLIFSNVHGGILIGASDGSTNDYFNVKNNVVIYNSNMFDNTGGPASLGWGIEQYVNGGAIGPPQ